jgi:hypothetical protein
MAKIKTIEGFTAGETDFINEHTRHLLATVWAPQQISGDTVVVFAPTDKLFYEHAKRRGWITKRDEKVSGSGFKAAAAFLRR